MKEGDIIVVAIAPDTRGIHAYGGFDTPEDAADFVASDVLPEQYTEIAILPIEMVRPLDEDDADVV